MRRRFLAGLLMLALSGTAAFARPLPFQHSPAGNSPATPIAPIPEVDSHRCCHFSAAPSLEIAPPLAPASMPCGGQHSCCVRPAPANSPNLPSVSSPTRPGIQRGALPPDHPDQYGCRVAATSSRHRDFMPYGLFSTVLRI